MIRAIETVYDGYRFRSRLEARWGVFFNALKIPYEYEREGFDLGDAGWYLPDFWLPDPIFADRGWGFWCEIKPTKLTEEEWAKALALAKYTKHNVLLFQGSPWPEKYTVSKISIVHTMQITHGLVFEQDDPYIHLRNEDGFTSFPMSNLSLDFAYRAARQARFEHGEKPAVW